MSDYVRTYSWTHTRGYYFQAPVDFSVTHVECPDEVPSNVTGDVQVVALYRFTGTAIPTTAAATPVFYSGSVPSGQRIALKTPVAYKKGEWFMVLGGMAVPTTGNLRNSYGNANYASSVLGNAVQLTRCGMQINIGGTKGVGTPFVSTGGNIARVRVWVKGQGSGEQYGQGKGAKDTILDYSDPNPPTVGKTGGVIIRTKDANNNGSALSLGLLRVDVPSPFNGNLLSSPNLLILIKPTPVKLGALGGERYTFPIPNNASLLGKKLTFQGAVGNPTKVLALTNGMEWVLGM